MKAVLTFALMLAILMLSVSCTETETAPHKLPTSTDPNLETLQNDLQKIKEQIETAKSEYEQWLAEDAETQPSDNSDENNFPDMEKQMAAAKAEYEKWLAEDAANTN